VALTKWVVESRRAFPNTPQYVDIWWPDFVFSDTPNVGFLGQVVLYEEVSAANPYGRFEFIFKALDKADPNGPPVFSGTLKTITRPDGQPQFVFIMEEGDVYSQSDGYNLMAANTLLYDVAGTSGVAKTFLWDSDRAPVPGR